MLRNYKHENRVNRSESTLFIAASQKYQNIDFIDSIIDEQVLFKDRFSCSLFLLIRLFDDESEASFLSS